MSSLSGLNATGPVGKRALSSNAKRVGHGAEATRSKPQPCSRSASAQAGSATAAGAAARGA